MSRKFFFETTLEEFPLPRALENLHERGFTGRVVIRRGDITKAIFLISGAPVNVDSTLRDETLGRFLVKKGRITDLDFDRSIQLMMEQNIQQGAALVKLGCLSPKELYHEVKAQTREKLVSAFAWTTGFLGCYQEIEFIADLYRFEMPMPAVMREGIIRFFPPGAAEGQLARVAGGPVSFVPGFAERLPGFELSQKECELLELVEMEVRDLLNKYEFPGDTIPIIRGNAKGALDNPSDPKFNKCIGELMDALDNHIPEPTRERDKPFLMAIEDVFSIEGRGTVVTGRIESGVVRLNDKVQIIGLAPTQDTVVTGIEMFNKLLDEGQAGDNVGLLLRGIAKDKVERGQVLAKPGSITPHTKFECKVYVLSKEEGGRHTPFFSGYKPQFYFRTTDVTGTTKLLDGADMCMPGDNVRLEVELGKPIAMQENVRFAIREGGKTVGSGVVTKILE